MLGGDQFRRARANARPVASDKATAVHRGSIDPDGPLLESVEGYVRTIRPDLWRAEVSPSVRDHENRAPKSTTDQPRAVNFREPLEVTLPNLLPERHGGATTSGGSHRDDGTERHVIPVGEDRELELPQLRNPVGASLASSG